MLIDKVSPVCEIVFNFIQFPSATRLGLYVRFTQLPLLPPFWDGRTKRENYMILLSWEFGSRISFLLPKTTPRKRMPQLDSNSQTRVDNSIGVFWKEIWDSLFWILCKKWLNLQISKISTFLQIILGYKFECRKHWGVRKFMEFPKFLYIFLTIVSSSVVWARNTDT